MKGNDKKALHSKTLAELTALLKEKRDLMLKNKMEKAINKVKNVHILASLRRDIAIIETIKREKEIKNG